MNNTEVVLAAVGKNGYAWETHERGPEEHHGGRARGGEVTRLCPADTRAWSYEQHAGRACGGEKNGHARQTRER